MVHYSGGGFVNGVCSYLNRYIAAQSNDRRVAVWSSRKVGIHSNNSKSQKPIIDINSNSSKPLASQAPTAETVTTAAAETTATVTGTGASGTESSSPEGFRMVIDERDAFIKGPSDIPYNRRGR